MAQVWLGSGRDGGSVRVLAGMMCLAMSCCFCSADGSAVPALRAEQGGGECSKKRGNEEVWEWLWDPVPV